jgi:hypothetical protein
LAFRQTDLRRLSACFDFVVRVFSAPLAAYLLVRAAQCAKPDLLNDLASRPLRCMPALSVFLDEDRAVTRSAPLQSVCSMEIDCSVAFYQHFHVSRIVVF